MASVPAPTIALALRTALSLRAASVQWHPLSRWVASIAAALGGDRWRACRGVRSSLPLDTHRPKRVDVWHPRVGHGCHTASRQRAVCERARANVPPCPRTALSLKAASVQWHPSSRGVASIAAALGGDRWRVCRRERSPLPAAPQRTGNNGSAQGVVSLMQSSGRRRSGPPCSVNHPKSKGESLCGGC